MAMYICSNRHLGGQRKCNTCGASADKTTLSTAYQGPHLVTAKNGNTRQVSVRELRYLSAERCAPPSARGAGMQYYQPMLFF
jgi:hypothetical protein